MKDIGLHVMKRPIHKAARGGRSLLLSFLFLGLILTVRAQPGLVGRVVLSVDDPLVTATIDKPEAAQGERVRLTLAGLGSRQSAVVTAGLSASATDYPLEKLSATAYTFLMPSSTLYINVRVAAASGYLIRVQTPGVSGAKVRLETLSAAGGAGTAVEAGTPSIAKGAKVRASLTLPTEEKGTFSLRELAGYATDGSWTLLPVGTEVPKEVTFVMPASDVVLRYAIGYEANTTDTPKEDSPEAPKIEVSEIVWPANPQEKPVLIVISEVEEGRQAPLSERLAAIVTGDPESVSVAVEVYDLSGRRYLSAAAAESHQLSLPSGLWLVRLGDGPTEKIVVP